MIQRAEDGSLPDSDTHMFVVYVQVQKPGPSFDAIETKLCDGVIWLEGVGKVEAHYLATAELVQADLESQVNPGDVSGFAASLLKERGEPTTR